MEEDSFQEDRDQKAEQVAAKIFAAILELITLQDRAQEISELWSEKRDDLNRLCKLAFQIKCNLISSYDEFTCVWHKSGTQFEETTMVAEDPGTRNVNDDNIVNACVQPGIIRHQQLIGGFIVSQPKLLSKAVVSLR